jgi:mono/diheme cytochrome c family protein
MKAVRLLAPAVLSVIVGGSAASAADPARGKEIYVKVGCYACHGYEGQGGVTGPKVAPDPMPPDALASFIRNSAPTLMPHYSEKILGDAEVAEIHAYLASVKKPASAKDIPLLNNP